MNTQKVAITMPFELVSIIDMIAKKQKISRSKYISTVLQEKVMQEKNQTLKDAYDQIFKDDSIKKEQVETAKWFEGSGNKKGQEW